jgi:hypothetical protein
MTISREDPRFWDVRTIERRIRQGMLSRKDYEKHLKSLPDVADKAQPFDLDALDQDDDFDDELEDEARHAAPPAAGDTAAIDARSDDEGDDDDPDDEGDEGDEGDDDDGDDEA